MGKLGKIGTVLIYKDKEFFGSYTQVLFTPAMTSHEFERFKQK